MNAIGETYYVIRANGCRLSEHFSIESEAISQAREMNASGDKCSVDIMESYGREKSAMMVWPEVGRAYAVAK